MTMTESASNYWAELARHPQGYVLFHTFRNPMRPPWVQLKLMRPAIPGRRIARRVWLKWNADRQCLARTPLAEELPEIYAWVRDVLEAEAAREVVRRGCHLMGRNQKPGAADRRRDVVGKKLAARKQLTVILS